MVDLRGPRLEELAENVSNAAGALPRAVRRVLTSGVRIPGELGELAELVTAGGAGVTDGHIRRLPASG